MRAWIGVLWAVACLIAGSSAMAAPPPPRPDAAAWLVFAPGRGGILTARAIDIERPIASLTKLMTAHLVLRSGRLNAIAVAGNDAVTVGESVVPLHLGERQSVRALLEALIVRSANDAAVDLADAVGGTEQGFVQRMNAEARRLGLRHTSYVTPYGLDTTGQYSSARDVLRLSLLDMASPIYRRFAREQVANIPGHTGLVARNSLLAEYAGLDGVKTGHTDLAGWCLSASAVHDGIRLYAIVLGSPNEAQRNADVARLLDWGFGLFNRVHLIDAGQGYGRVQLAYGGSVAVHAATSVVRIARASETFSERVVLPDLAPRPLRRGETVGRVEVMEHGRVLSRVALVADGSVSTAGVAQQLRWLVGRAFGDVAGLRV